MQVTPSEQGLRDVTQLVTTFPQGFMTWQGPIMPLIILCHPDMVRVVTNASGTHTELDPALVPSYFSAVFLFMHPNLLHPSNAICPHPGVLGT